MQKNNTQPRSYAQISNIEEPPQQSPASSFFQIVLGVVILVLAIAGLIAAHNTFLAAAPYLVWTLIIIAIAVVPLYLIGKGTIGAHAALHQIKRTSLATKLAEKAVGIADEELEAMKAARTRDNERAAAETEKMRAEARRIDAEAHKLITSIEWDEQGNAARWDPYTREITQLYGQMREHPGLHSLNYRYDYKDTSVREEEQKRLGPGGEKAIPGLVRYDDIRHLVPNGHTLLGMGENGLESRPFSILCTCWICGGSKTGKSNTVALKVGEAYALGSWFCVIDPHRHKDDSLYNSIKGYRGRFLAPGCATDPEEILEVLKAFLREALARMNDPTHTDRTPIILLIDEIGHICDTTGLEGEDLAIAKETVAYLKKISRMCGQELRGFKMFGWFISQTATGLAWLRKNAMTVIAHKMLMMSEREIACNGDTAIARSMDTWPIGRVLIYGLDFPDGHLITQMPVLAERIVDADPDPRNSVPDNSPGTLALVRDEDDTVVVPEPKNISFFEEKAQKKEINSGTLFTPGNPLPRQSEQDDTPVPDSTRTLPTNPHGNRAEQGGTGISAPSSDEKRFTPEQESEFIRRFRANGSIKETLSQMHIGYGRYQKHASQIVFERKLRKA